MGALEGLITDFTTGNPFSGTQLLEVSIGWRFGGSVGANYRLYNWKPVFGTKLLEGSIGRGFGGSEEVNAITTGNPLFLGQIGWSWHREGFRGL